jgi:hypothetical protein
MNPTIEELTAAAEREARKRPEVLRLMTHPGVGPLTALAYVLIIGTPSPVLGSGAGLVGRSGPWLRHFSNTLRRIISCGFQDCSENCSG